jgi:cellulose synthase/poly-beta-1,6-N-acetylglucosamine synthase-like glycosyltransferase
MKTRSVSLMHLQAQTRRLHGFQDQPPAAALRSPSEQQSKPRQGRDTSAPPATAPASDADSTSASVTGIFRAGSLALRVVDLARHRPSAPLLNRRPASFWLRHCAIPWVQLGDTIAIAFADAEEAERQRQELTACFGPFIPVLAPRDQISALLLHHFKTSMARRASASIAPELSSRTLFEHSGRLKQLLPLTSTLTLAALYPVEVFSVFCALAVVLLTAFAALKLCGVIAYLAQQQQQALRPPKKPKDADMPNISVLVPLYKEAAISSALLKRLRRLQYPKDRMEILLVLEEGDTVTRHAIAAATLPSWVQVIEVPAWGALKTKPRALNYALNFCRGEIIGVWDAEDAPVPDQLQQVAAAFAAAPPEVACFQGVLDYYNPQANWISRCFTLEYASWFRVVLPGIAKLGLVVPLGGTTMFVRRKILDDLGGWDSHNVTEDADLGVRLFRAGYRTEMLPSTTFEEATCTPPAWTRQRSRWLKGFMATYLVHMRQPVQLMRDLGWRAFLGFQVFFLGTVGLFLLAPFLWSFWLLAFGMPHPSTALWSDAMVTTAFASMIFFEGLGMCIAVIAAFAARRPHLAPWALTLPFYFLMGPFAVYRALHGLLFDPFFWDKTSHGLHPPDAVAQAAQQTLASDDPGPATADQQTATQEKPPQQICATQSLQAPAQEALPQETLAQEEPARQTSNGKASDQFLKTAQGLTQRLGPAE